MGRQSPSEARRRSRQNRSCRNLMQQKRRKKKGGVGGGGVGMHQTPSNPKEVHQRPPLSLLLERRGSALAQRSRAVAPTLGLGPPKRVSIDRLRLTLTLTP